MNSYFVLESAGLFRRPLSYLRMALTDTIDMSVNHGQVSTLYIVLRVELQHVPHVGSLNVPYGALE